MRNVLFILILFFTFCFGEDRKEQSYNYEVHKVCQIEKGSINEETLKFSVNGKTSRLFFINEKCEKSKLIIGTDLKFYTLFNQIYDVREAKFYDYIDYNMIFGTHEMSPILGLQGRYKSFGLELRQYLGNGQTSFIVDWNRNWYRKFYSKIGINFNLITKDNILHEYKLFLSSSNSGEQLKDKLKLDLNNKYSKYTSSSLLYSAFFIEPGYKFNFDLINVEIGYRIDFMVLFRKNTIQDGIMDASKEVLYRATPSINFYYNLSPYIR